MDKNFGRGVFSSIKSMRCRFCFQTISSLLECRYYMCSHCVANYFSRPLDMSFEEWLSQFKELHEKQFSSLKNGSNSHPEGMDPSSR